MPYHLEKGAALKEVERYLNKPLPARLDVLTHLRDGNQRLGSATLNKPALAGYNAGNLGAGYANLLDYVRDRWFGANPNSTYWLDYEGDVEGIVRLALIRAVEISLGVVHGDTPPVATREWPIELLWHCSQRWFEAWVTWQTFPGGSGHVLVLLATPAHSGGNITADPLHPEHIKPNYAATEIVAPPYGLEGMWVVTDRTHVQQLVLGNGQFNLAGNRLTDTLPAGAVPIPFIGTRWLGGNGIRPMPPVAPLTQLDFPDLVTVEPNLAAGGVN
jgi:hypothetical protein